MSEGKEFSLDAEQMRKANAFTRRHYRKHEKEKGEGWDGAAGGAFTYQFTPTGLGMVSVVRCACGKEKNLTDYGSW